MSDPSIRDERERDDQAIIDAVKSSRWQYGAVDAFNERARTAWPEERAKRIAAEAALEEANLQVARLIGTAQGERDALMAEVEKLSAELETCAAVAYANWCGAENLREGIVSPRSVEAGALALQRSGAKHVDLPLLIRDAEIVLVAARSALARNGEPE